MLEIRGGELLRRKELVGMSADERKQFAVTFPMDYAEVAARAVTCCSTCISRDQGRDLPPLGDDLAKASESSRDAR